ncbi:MAG: radical SAM protein [Lachnospiraceae bacterium]|nr:radical SAM protein [Lachnospiraceae bacterium]
MKKIGIINKIIAFSNVDGPGNRTAVFFQGCNLKCLYCHNPETIHFCVGCGQCVEVCPAGALTVGVGKRQAFGSPYNEGTNPSTLPRTRGRDVSEADRAGATPCPLPDAGEGGPPPQAVVGEGDLLQPITWTSPKCVSCDACIKACPHLASPKTRRMTAEELVTEIKKTAPYINGVSFSGGECTLQRDFLVEVIPLIRQLGLGVLLDSNGTYDFEKDPVLLEMIDGVMLDIKAADPAVCRTLTGAGPELPIKNLKYLQSVGKLAEVRTVLLPEGSASVTGEGDLYPTHSMNELTVRTVASLLDPAIPYKLLRYRPFGVRQEGIEIIGNTITEESDAEALAALARSLGAENCRVV